MLFTLYTPTIPWDFQYSFSNMVLHVKEALPGFFCQNLVHILMRLITIRSQSFIRIRGNFLGDIPPLHPLLKRTGRVFHPPPIFPSTNKFFPFTPPPKQKSVNAGPQYNLFGCRPPSTSCIGAAPSFLMKMHATI